ncbi:hypothetical protein HIM_10926 [Hirsutella minnesotensis 3608]|uniref:PiggyBac transposable element-derived protein domain-containing protein n=1 Tax=Hirsutella minnesotensis 3608 TaxID=1043627 RepID=A0A0F8A1T1_9HYPO|nr:hypothetical protein HIM_10926 [Hirsutella minnesotensis 3608]
MDSPRPVAVTNQFDDELLIRIDNSLCEHPSDNTCRPALPPLPTRGSKFEPLEVPFRAPEVRNLPTTALALFEAFVPLDLVEKWVLWTNREPFSRSQAPLPHSRRLRWTPITPDEVYIWLAILIYLGLHRERRIQDHWKTSRLGIQRPTHPIVKFMTFDRFTQILRNLRLCDPDNLISTDFDYVNDWSSHIQQISLHLYNPGSMIAIDECMIRYTGRSKQTTRVPSKPVPVGYKVWASAQRGYFLSWIWHLPKQAMGSAAEPIRRKKPGNNDQIYLNPTQSVVPALIKLLPEQPYHVFLDNLFSSPNLFVALRRRGVGATGTARTNSGIDKELVQWKADDSKGKLQWPWGKLQAYPTPDNLINQIAWKDNALVLMLSTVHTGNEIEERIRKRPANVSKPQQRAIKEEFKDKHTKKLKLPIVTVEYNDEMGSVDVGDQLRGYMGYDHITRRGGWKAIAYGFLLDTALINTFILQQRGNPQWQTFDSQIRWRSYLIDQLIQHHATNGTSRQRYRAGAETLPMSEHIHKQRGKCSRCVACQGFRLGQVRSQSQQQRPPLGALDDDSKWDVTGPGGNPVMRLPPAPILKRAFLKGPALRVDPFLSRITGKMEGLHAYETFGFDLAPPPSLVLHLKTWNGLVFHTLAPSNTY